MKHLDVKKLKVGVNILKEGVYVYKKVWMEIAQLYLPEGSKVVKTKGRSPKYRADYSICTMVVPAYSVYKHKVIARDYRDLKYDCFCSLFRATGRHVLYRIGKPITPKFKLDENPNNSCSSGIYFWETLKKAENY